mmetsp:Transcript_5077/g.16792  ORF Transcript_5077/g.16792 Transcript_5077/m.16792 type:complete len:243 (+) Transcript_5077:103-831(+)|eukprot:scaffold5010_cov110-Isochrysis_galbana.AAC.1
MGRQEAVQRHGPRPLPRERAQAQLGGLVVRDEQCALEAAHVDRHALPSEGGLDARELVHLSEQPCRWRRGRAVAEAGSLGIEPRLDEPSRTARPALASRPRLASGGGGFASRRLPGAVGWDTRAMVVWTERALSQARHGKDSGRQAPPALLSAIVRAALGWRAVDRRVGPTGRQAACSATAAHMRYGRCAAAVPTLFFPAVRVAAFPPPRLGIPDFGHTHPRHRESRQRVLVIRRIRTAGGS